MYRFAELCNFCEEKSHSQVFRRFLETLIAMPDPAVAVFLLREAGPVLPSHTALPEAVCSFRYFHS